ncbi:MAG: hypothetical protein KJZ93_08850 [Caldilineaceae bacterium]|nr:hypothetical protein [Caldilineaceae bacterium]
MRTHGAGQEAHVADSAQPTVNFAVLLEGTNPVRSAHDHQSAVHAACGVTKMKD